MSIEESTEAFSLWAVGDARAGVANREAGRELGPLDLPRVTGGLIWPRRRGRGPGEGENVAIGSVAYRTS
jgi:hypothetical protein